MTDEAQTCTMTLVRAFDSITCYLEAGHAGPHKDKTGERPFFWQYEVLR